MECKSLGKRPRIVKMIRGPAAILILSRKRKNSTKGCLRRFSNRGCEFQMYTLFKTTTESINETFLSYDFFSKKNNLLHLLSLEFKVVDPRKLELRQKQIILLSRIAILLLKGYFGREKINFHEKNLKYRKIILLINFIFSTTFYLIASCQILKNYAILINYQSLLQEKDSLQLAHFQFSKMNKLFSNSALCL